MSMEKIDDRQMSGDCGSGAGECETSHKEDTMNAMNKDEVKGKADQMIGKIKETWGRLTDDEVALYNGRRDQFFGKLQEKYGLMKDEAEDRLRELEDTSRERAA